MHLQYHLAQADNMRLLIRLKHILFAESFLHDELTKAAGPQIDSNGYFEQQAKSVSSISSYH